MEFRRFYIFYFSLGFIALGGPSRAYAVPEPSLVDCVQKDLRKETSLARAHTQPLIPPETYQELLKLQKSGWTPLHPPLEIHTRAGTFTADFYLGGSSSQVFLDEKRGKLLKFYHANSPTADYEQLVTEFLLSHGERVPKIVVSEAIELAEPKVVLRPGPGSRPRHGAAAETPVELAAGQYRIVVKDYFEGLTEQTLSLVRSTPTTPQPTLSAEARDQLEAEIIRIRATYFARGPSSFLNWLRARSPAVPAHYEKMPLFRFGDIGEGSFLLSPERGWVINDP